MASRLPTLNLCKRNRLKSLAPKDMRNESKKMMSCAMFHQHTYLSKSFGGNNDDWMLRSLRATFLKAVSNPLWRSLERREPITRTWPMTVIAQPIVCFSLNFVIHTIHTVWNNLMLQFYGEPFWRFVLLIGQSLCFFNIHSEWSQVEFSV